MLEQDKIDKISKALSDALPEDLVKFKDGLHKNFSAVLQSQLNKMDIVSREEFDIQSKVLAKTRAKLEALEAQVKALEKE